MKKFLKKAEGFTLVELIVVIAILGILTAIAVPTYSGYVKKASKANDDQLLSGANTAIAAACAENGVALAEVANYLDATFASKALKIADASGIAANANDILEDFTTYAGYNATNGIVFEYYTNVDFSDGSNGVPAGNLVGTEPN